MHLEDALWRLKSPSSNYRGADMMMGGAYWRLAKALKFVDAHLDAFEGDHAAFVRKHHGRLKPAEADDVAPGGSQKES